MAIEACRLARVPLKIVGSGPDRAKLEQASAGAEVQFLGRLSNEEIRDLYRSAAVVLMPGEEDFGLVPVEAQACGRPVVAYGRGGALESILPDETGLLVQEATPTAFADAIAHKAASRVTGYGLDDGVQMGAVISAESRDRIVGLVGRAAAQGARLVVDGRNPKIPNRERGNFIRPTVLDGLPFTSDLTGTEIFGPVLCVIAYDSDDEAIRIANDSKYGLHSAVLGTDLKRARRVASQIRAGRVVINGMTDDPQAPWGGFKYSGFGREYGQYGIEAFLETRAILES